MLAIRSVWVQRCVTHWFVDDDVTIANLDVVEAVWVSAYPCLELNRCSLAAEIR